MRMQVIAGSHKITPQRLQKLKVAAHSPREVNISQSANRKRGARSNWGQGKRVENGDLMVSSERRRGTGRD